MMIIAPFSSARIAKTAVEEKKPVENPADATVVDDEEMAAAEDVEEEEQEVDAVEETVTVNVSEGADKVECMEVGASEKTMVMVICPPGKATRIHKDIVVHLLPKLHRCLTGRVERRRFIK